MTKEDITTLCSEVRNNLRTKSRIFLARKKIIETALNTTKRRQEPTIEQLEIIHNISEWIEPWQGKCPK